MKKIASLSLVASLSLFGAAYKIPEQSARSVALAGAYVAAAKDADTSFFNPANMSFMDDGHYLELSLTGAFLPKIDYSGKQVTDPTTTPPTTMPASNESKSEKFLIPHLHYVGPAFGKWRFGASITTPAGTSKRWSSAPQSWFANKYTLRVAEFNPALSYKVNENFSVGAGARVIFTDGKIILNKPQKYYNLDGDVQTRFGYNVALSYRLKELTLATTYRSKVDLKEKGTAHYITNTDSITTTGRVKVPLPAIWTVAAALEINEKATFEIVYERTFWSSYKRLDITFDDPRVEEIHAEKNWNDTNTFRVGLTYKNSPKLTTMYGFAYDETPVPAKTLGYELPDSDALIFSAGALYSINDQMKIGISYLYDYKLDRTLGAVSRTQLENQNGIYGTFSNLRAHLLNLSFAYRF